MTFNTIATIVGSPDFGARPYRDHSPAQLAALRDQGVTSIFVNMAWSRPWLDAVTLEEVVVGQSYPWLSDTSRVTTDIPSLQDRVAAVADAGLRPFFLYGCPKQIDFATVPPEAHERTQALVGAPVSRIGPQYAVACIQSAEVRQHYRELLTAHFAMFPATAGFLFYTMDELAEVCDELDPCPRCHGIPLHARLPDFLAFLRGVIDDIKPGVEMWWEPWEFTATQTFALAERLDPRITLSLHSNIHEVYFANQADAWFRHICRIADERGIPVIAELFLAGSGEDLGPVPAFPCPRLVYDQLRSVHDLPAVAGIKEYYGTVVEHMAVNDRMFRAFVHAPQAPFADLIAAIAADYGTQAVPDLLAAWEHAARAIETYPWLVSWRLRLYNTLRYDQHPGPNYWQEAFVDTLVTPWTTPSWESSRQSAYIVSYAPEVMGARMLEETAQQFERCIAHLDQTITHLHAALAGYDHEDALWSEVERQLFSVVVVRHMTLARLNHLNADRCAAIVRATADTASIAALHDVLTADYANARALLAAIEHRADHGFDLGSLRDTLISMEHDLRTYDTDPITWASTHFVRKGNRGE